MKQFFVASLIVVAALGLFFLMANVRRERPRKPPRPFVRTVHTTKVHYRPLGPAITATGRARAEEHIRLTPQVSGTVLERDFRLRKGMSFSRNQVLMRIDSRETLYTLQTTVSELQNALAGLLPILKTDMPEAYERWSSFFTQLEGIDIPQLPETGAQREKLLVTRHNIYRLYYTARNQLLLLSRHVLRAPFSGTVADASLYPSSMARAGSPVATIACTDRIELELALTPHEAARISRGTRAVVNIAGSEDSVDGTVHRIGEAVDEKMQTLPVFVRVTEAASQGLRSGSYATVTLSADTIKHAVEVPRKALHEGNRVYVIEDGALAERQVTVTHTGVETAYITGGLLQGATLIVEPLQDAAVGMAVKAAGAPARANDDGRKEHEARVDL